jgi:perosamine synthetase
MIASVFAIVYTGATPVLVDSEPETFTIDVSKIEEKITTRTRAIMPVHIYGHPCDMDPIMELAAKYHLSVVEDAAEAHGAEYKGIKAGGIGHINCFSFYANKIITCGEGGMVVTNDRELADRARRIKDLAHAPEQRFLHREIGFNYRMTNLQAAIGLAQFEHIEQLVQLRRKNARLYNERLKDIPGLTLPVEKSWAKNVYWMYGVLVQDKFGMTRDDLMARLKQDGIDTRGFFVPMHRQPVFTDMGLFHQERYPVAEDIGLRGFYLPSSSGLREANIELICKKIKQAKR